MEIDIHRVILPEFKATLDETDPRNCGGVGAAPSTKENPSPEREDQSLEEAAQHEREYLRGRLRDELKREPSAEELNEWLRRHTEGY
jgi:hypothetical protein